MFVVYKPAGQPEQRWHFLPGRLRVAEMEAIERRTNLPYSGAFKQNLLQGGTAARRALLWTLLRREHHTLKFEDVDFFDDELELQLDRDELAAEIAGMETFDGVTEAERAAGLALLREQLATAPYPPGKEPPAPEPAPEPAPDLPERPRDQMTMPALDWPATYPPPLEPSAR